jgi:hypothetical protein
LYVLLRWRLLPTHGAVLAGGLVNAGEVGDVHPADPVFDAGKALGHGGRIFAEPERVLLQDAVEEDVPEDHDGPLRVLEGIDDEVGGVEEQARVGDGRRDAQDAGEVAGVRGFERLGPGTEDMVGLLGARVRLCLDLHVYGSDVFGAQTQLTLAVAVDVVVHDGAVEDELAGLPLRLEADGDAAARPLYEGVCLAVGLLDAAARPGDVGVERVDGQLGAGDPDPLLLSRHFFLSDFQEKRSSEKTVYSMQTPIRRLNPTFLDLYSQGGNGPLPIHPHSWQRVFPDWVSHTTVVPGSVAAQHVEPMTTTDGAFFGGSYPAWAWSSYASNRILRQ